MDGKYSIELFRTGGEGAGIEKILVRHDSLTVARTLYKVAALNCFARNVFFMRYRALDCLDCLLDGNESLAHPFRLAALVWLGQCTRNTATLFYLTVPGLDQFSRVLIFFSHAVNSRWFTSATFQLVKPSINFGSSRSRRPFLVAFCSSKSDTLAHC